MKGMIVLLMIILFLLGILISSSSGAVHVPIEIEQDCLKERTKNLSKEALNEPLEFGECHLPDSEFDNGFLHDGECPNHDGDGDGRCDLEFPVHSEEGITPVCPVGRC
jgi:hypothetical protein